MLLLLWKILPNELPNYRHFCHSQYATLTSSTLIAIQSQKPTDFSSLPICHYLWPALRYYDAKCTRVLTNKAHKVCNATCRAGFIDFKPKSKPRATSRSQKPKPKAEAEAEHHKAPMSPSGQAHHMSRDIYLPKSIKINCKNRDSDKPTTVNK